MEREHGRTNIRTMVGRMRQRGDADTLIWNERIVAWIVRAAVGRMNKRAGAAMRIERMRGSKDVRMYARRDGRKQGRTHALTDGRTD